MITVSPDIASASVLIDAPYSGAGNFAVWRYYRGSLTRVRNWRMPSGTLVPPDRDYEAPLGVEIGYSFVSWTTGAEPDPPMIPQATTTVAVPANEAWLKFPAHPEDNIRMSCVTSLPQRTFADNVGIHRVIGRTRPVAVHDVMSWWSGSISWITDGVMSHDSEVAAITTGGIMLLQTPPGYGTINEYVVSTGLRTAHAVLARETMTEREMVMSFQTTDEPVGDTPVMLSYTYAGVTKDWATYGSPGHPDMASLLWNYLNYYRLLRNRANPRTAAAAKPPLYGAGP